MNQENIEKSLSEILVKDIMSKALISVDPSTTAFQVAKMMQQGGIGALIVKKDDKPAGIITDRDFAIKIAVDKVPIDTPIDKVASYPLLTISSNEPIVAAANLMASKKVRKLVVLENDKVVGIITSTDLVNQLAKI